jgi:hypothetical protein
VSTGHSLPFADDRVLLNLAAYWSAKRAGYPLPPRSAIDPLDMPRRLLPYLALVEPTGKGREIRFRLVGTELAQRFGRDATGKTSTDLYGGTEYVSYLEDIYATVFTKAQPLFVETVRVWTEEGHGRVRRLLLPMAAEAGSEQVAFVLSALSWAPADSQGGHQPPAPRQRLIAVEALEKGVLQATFRGMFDAP